MPHLNVLPNETGSYQSRRGGMIIAVNTLHGMCLNPGWVV